MSRWLKSVNTLLDNLDGHVEDQIVYNDSDEEEAYQEDDEEYMGGEEDDIDVEVDSDDYDQEDEAIDEEIDFVEDDAPQQPGALRSIQGVLERGGIDVSIVRADEEESYEQVQAPSSSSNDDDEQLERKGRTGTQTSDQDNTVERDEVAQDSTTMESSIQLVEKNDVEETDSTLKREEKDVAVRPQSNVLKPPPSGGSILSALSTGPPPSTGSPLQQQLYEYKRLYKKSQGEMRKLKKQVTSLTSQLQSADAEMDAQREELDRAAKRLERDRHRHKEDKEEMEEDHEEELENQKDHYEEQLEKQKERYEEQLDDLRARLERNEEIRRQEGGDWNKELEEAIHREQHQLGKLSEIQEENASHKKRISELEQQQTLLQSRYDSLIQTAETSANREREAEDKLDAALSLNARQLSKKQTREVELERTVADLSAALVVARQREQTRGARSKEMQCGTLDKHGEHAVSWKSKCEAAEEELETVNVQLSIERQRTETMQQELEDISKERTEETIEVQTKQRQYDRQVADLTSSVARLQTSLREAKKNSKGASSLAASSSSTDHNHAEVHQKEQHAQNQIATLSEQLLRQQGKIGMFNSEILALKSRLKSATSRAENAERALTSTSGVHSGEGVSSRSTGANVYDLESGVIGPFPGQGHSRKRGGARTRNKVMSIRSALQMNPGRGNEQLGQTIDALDSFVLETGTLLGYNPLARLIFLLYFSLLHLWAFCLVVFHAHCIEEEHGDFGSAADMMGPEALLKHAVKNSGSP